MISAFICLPVLPYFSAGGEAAANAAWHEYEKRTQMHSSQGSEKLGLLNQIRDESKKHKGLHKITARQEKKQGKVPTDNHSNTGKTH